MGPGDGLVASDNAARRIPVRGPTVCVGDKLFKGVVINNSDQEDESVEWSCTAVAYFGER